jgi:ferredoxin-NADP reductase
MKFEQYTLRGISNETEEVRTFKFAKEDGSIPAYQPGHFFLLRMSGEDGKPSQRSYSASSHPSEPMLSFCIKLKGAFTHLLWKLKEGDKVEIDGPYGIFLLKSDDAERVFIGGGVGISALRSMIIQTVNTDKKPSCLFHSARGLENLIYRAEMEKLAANNAFRLDLLVRKDWRPDAERKARHTFRENILLVRLQGNGRLAC